jgi:long-subunit fatty acid transport protein
MFSAALPPRPAFLAGLGIASCFALTLTAPVEAHAGGFEIPDHGARALGRGGAYAVGAKDLTAMHYNPATMAKFRGTRVMISHNSIHQDMTYTRAPLSDGWTQGLGNDVGGTEFGPVTNGTPWFLLGAFAVISSDFGLDNATFFAGMHGPSAVGEHHYPDYGAQAFQLTKMKVLTVFYHVGGAWKYHSPTKKRDVFGIGGSLAYAMLPTMEYGLLVDNSTLSTNDPGDFNIYRPIPSSDPLDVQGLTTLKLQDNTGISGNLGVWYRPIDQIELGVAGRVIPTNFSPEGSMTLTPDDGVPVDEVEVKMKRIPMPVMLRAGVRYVGMKGERELFDIEVDAQWENWAQLGAYDVDFENVPPGLMLFPIKMQKNWQDTISVRAGGDYNVVDKHLWLRAGGFYETGAVPDAFAHLDFPSFDRGGVGLGLTAGFPGAEFSVGYQHIFQRTVEVTEASSRVYQQRPQRPCPQFCGEDLDAGVAGANGVPANAGSFESSYDMIGVSVDLNFTQLRDNAKAKKVAPKVESAQ